MISKGSTRGYNLGRRKMVLAEGPKILERMVDEKHGKLKT